MSAAGLSQGANCAPSGGQRSGPISSGRKRGGPMTRLSVDSTGHGPPLVLLHGWAMHSGIWGGIVAQLARSHRVHAVDLPGHGHSAPVTPCTLDAIVAAVDATLADEARPLTVLGWSLGGLVAMRWAESRQARVNRLALVCTTPRFVAGADWPHAMSAEAITRFGDELHVAWKLTVQRFLALQVHNSVHGRATLAALREQLWARGEPSRPALMATLDVLIATDLRDSLARIAQPTLVIAGSRDTLTPPAAGRWLADAIAGARFAEIAGSAHTPFLSHRDEFFALLEGFLGQR